MRRVTELGYTIELTNEGKEFLAVKGYDIQYGARPLKRALQSYIEDEISELLLCGTLKQGDHIIVEVESGSDKLKFTVQN